MLTSSYQTYSVCMYREFWASKANMLANFTNVFKEAN